jgi:hypothetical protein
MRRLQLIEFHEQTWLPEAIRDDITDILCFGLNLVGAYRGALPLLQEALRATDHQTLSGQTVIDLCSGGGGPWLRLAPELQSGRSTGLQIFLSDKFPNLTAFQEIALRSEGRVRFTRGPVDAMRVPAGLKGFRTMFTSFHHFSQKDAAAILQDAIDNGEGIAIFEITRRSLSTMALMIPWVVLLMACVPWVRPFRWSRILWSYFIPIIPLVLLFDGIVSCLRTYRPQELREMVEGLAGPSYEWNIGELLENKAPISYLIGYPKRTAEARKTSTGQFDARTSSL